MPEDQRGGGAGSGRAAPLWPRRSIAWVRGHARGVAGCAVVFAVGIAFGVAFGGGGSGHDAKSTTVVKVGENVTIGFGAGSSAP